MRKCPACGESYTRQFDNHTAGVIHFVHAGRDCIMDQELHVTVHELNEKIAELKQQLEQERSMRQKRARQLMAITRYATNQIYLLEIEEDVEENTHSACCADSRLSSCFCKQFAKGGRVGRQAPDRCDGSEHQGGAGQTESSDPVLTSGNGHLLATVRSQAYSLGNDSGEA